MATNKRIREWYARVEELCSLIVKRPELTWLWEIRIKILMYLIQRYGESEPEPTPPARRRPASFTWPKPGPGHDPCMATRRKQIHTLLENIHRVNCISKSKTAC
jgi:hypothetical protein